MSGQAGPVSLSDDAARRMREAMAAHERGDLARAEEGYRRLTGTLPGFADAWHYYGLLAHQRGESEAAVKLLRRAQTLAPDHVVFLINSGRVLSELGDYTQAIVCLGRALQLAPDDEQALVVYAQTLVEMGQESKALARLERRVQEPSADWRVWALLAKGREQANDRSGARLALDEAVKRAPEDSSAQHLRRAQGAGDTLTAELEFRAALQIEPRSGAAYLRLADVAMAAGEFVRAREWAGAALALDTRQWRAWALLATNPEASQDEAFVQRLAEAARNGAEDSGVAPLHFALGWINEQRGDYDRAFAAYARGNQIQGRHRVYDKGLQEDYVAGLIESLDATFTRRAATVGVTNSGGIFICGMPRSGTTLVEAIVAGRPEVTAGGEMLYVHDWLRRMLGPSNQDRKGAWLRAASDAQLHALAREWCAHLKRMAGNAARVTDKMPGNYHLLGLIHVCFPDALIVYVRRDPRDSGLSCFTTSFDQGHFFSHDLDAIGHYYRLHEQLMDHWRRVLGPQRLIEIEYEALVARPEAEARRLFSALGLPWDPACLRFHTAPTAARTASRIQVRQPLYQTSAGRWRRFERHLEPLLKALADPVTPPA